MKIEEKVYDRFIMTGLFILSLETLIEVIFKVKIK